MHQFHRGIEKRLTALERLVGTIPATETADQTARRLELVRLAHEGREPGDLTEEERATFLRIVASVPIIQEIVREGLLGDDGLPAGGDDHRDGYPHEDEDGNEAPVWRP